MQVVALRHHDMPAIEYAQLSRVKERLDRDFQYEQKLFDMADMLSRVEVAVFNGDLRLLSERANSLSKAAHQFGLMELALVAGDLWALAQRGDPVAIAAVCRRLVRVGDQSFEMAIQVES